MALEYGWYLVPPLIAGVVSALIGTYVFYKNHKDIATRVFFILMMSCSIWMFGEFAMQISGDVDTAYSYGKISTAGFVLMSVGLLHFTLVYPKLNIPENKRLLYSAALYTPAIILAILLLSTNLFFNVDTGVKEYAPDLFFDGDGPVTTGAGFADGPQGNFKQLAAAEPEYWFYYDTNDNDKFDANENRTETLVWDNPDRGLTDLVIRGKYGEEPDDRKELITAKNNDHIYWQDGNNSEGRVLDRYDPGEDIYIDNNGRSGIQTANITYVKLVEENYRYVTVDKTQGMRYYSLIIFFLAVIIVAILNILNRLIKTDNPKERAQMSYLSIGLIFIIFFILSYNVFGPYISSVILDGILTTTIALFFAIAVLKYNLMDIQLIIKKSLFYSVMFISIAGIFVVIGEVMEALIGTLLLPGSGSIISNIISAFIVAILFIPLTKHVRRFTDWLFPEARKFEKEYRDRLAAYESTFEAMMADGKLSRKEKEALDTLRDKLEISDAEHRFIVEKMKKLAGRD